MPTPLLIIAVLAIIVLIAIPASFRTVDQAHVAVVTMFGKYRRVLNPGLNVLIPFIESIHSRVPVQNQTKSLKFAAITNDQAQVHFSATIIFTVSDHSAETVQKVAFKFIDATSFATAMNSAVEASVREFVAGKRQAEILGLRSDIVEHAKGTLDHQLASWGYTLEDLQVNDIVFGDEIMASMERVVTAKNKQTAAEFEGQALLIENTKRAEAEGAAIKIAAEAEADAARLRGKGLADFRRELATGMSESAEVLAENGIGAEMLAFTMWTETVRDAAREGTGNVIFLDGSPDGMAGALHRMQGFMATDQLTDTKANLTASAPSNQLEVTDAQPTAAEHSEP